MPRQRDSKHDAGRTLDHFFFYKKPLAEKKHDRSRNPKLLKPRLRHKPSTCNNPEIIVIDSDSDELQVPVTCTGVVEKQRRAGQDVSMDVETVDADEISGRRTSAVDETISETQVLGPSLLATSSTITTTTNNSACTFGKPHLLSEGASVNPFLFGSPASLLSPSEFRDTSTSGLRIATENNSHPQTLKKRVKEEDNVQIGDLMEDWLMGDDENESEDKNGDVSDDDDDIEFVEEREVFLNTVSCCEKEFDGRQSPEVEVHIDNCPKARSSHQSTGNSKAPSASTKQSNKSDAFSVLMSSFKENEAWKEATAYEDRSFNHIKSNRGRRKAPFYKVLQGMPISVDAFRYGTIPGVTAYFLSHAHSDHYTNLSSSWKSGLIYCSQSTANLITHMLSVDKKWVRPLPMDTPTIIPDTNGVQVTLIEANHCPGSCLFLFEGRQTVNAGDSTFLSPYVGSSRIFRYLHCGDFRASPRHVMHPAIKGKKIDHVYLDTTYLDPKYTFPAQSLVISACAELSRRLLNGEPATLNNVMKSWLPSLPSLSSYSLSTAKGKNTLVVIGTYSIGKERIVKAVARALESKVYCDPRKTAILCCEDDKELETMLTADPLAAIVHLVPLGTITTDRLKIYMDQFKGVFTKAIGFRPTGWTYAQPAGTDLTPSVTSILTRTVHKKDFTYTDLHPSRKSSSSIQVYGVPYSEHSSFYELTCFAMSLNWTKMVATVNVGSEHSRRKMSKWVHQWEIERKKCSVDFMVTPRHEDYW